VQQKASQAHIPYLYGVQLQIAPTIAPKQCAALAPGAAGGRARTSGELNDHQLSPRKCKRIYTKVEHGSGFRVESRLF